MRALPLALLLFSSTALARQPSKPDQPPAAAADSAARAKADKALTRRIGAPPTPLINIHNNRTGEWLALDADPAATIEQPIANDFFRCHFTNEKTSWDVRLVPVLVGAALHFKVDHIEIVSGYRAPKYNLSLRKKGREVARDSQHTKGNAVDFRLPGVATTALRDYVRSLKLGGVGYYPESQFVHADTGPIRQWRGR